ncbi:cytochrome P450 monooxygenase-like protein [Amylocarpus encephaloides]|uniref:Cytochrome P450 monooxygenase-like protein n=1 Tax=Amylocarpus encephaloides TaxID=45428 RepID=A0A9P7YUV5_9HELO|nr:cytochrome P450 monooxygenase-like protein [Amylocarpus encephaloides]
MVSTVALAIGATALYWIYSNVSSLIKNVADAKRSGFPYSISPVAPYNTIWLVTYKLWVPLLKRLPVFWTEDWLPFLTPDWTWELLFEPVKRVGDLYMTVSPGGIYLWVTNAEAMHQITSRREAFPKPLESYKVLEVFGRNIITTEGGEWRKHRKIISPGFNEKNNVLVFSESCSQAQGMLRKWMGPEENGNITLEEVPTDTMRLTLHIISRIGFGVRLLWPGETPDEKEDAQAAVYSSNTPSSGHTMSFENSLSILLDRLFLVLMLPEWLLKRLPFQITKEAYESFINWRQYMNQIFAQKVSEAKAGRRSEGMDIMGSLVRSSYGKGESGKAILLDSDILGNAFLMIVAGHETTANSIHFSLVELAINPKPQRLAQKEVQNIFGDEPPEKWDYESSINSLLGGILGAVLNEELRLMPPVIAIPKSVTSDKDQELIVDGKKFTMPAGSRIALNTVGTQRNPRYWPSQPSVVSDRKDDLNDFRPERWLTKPGSDGKLPLDSAEDSDDDDDFGGFTGKSSHAKLFHPVRGSYLPFSDGPRSCVGRRLAQVKIMAVLAVIFQKYSIELAVDQWATDEELAKMSQEEKRAVYKKAQDKARKTIRTANSIITLKLHPGFIPVRVVRKGEEKFAHFID